MKKFSFLVFFVVMLINFSCGDDKEDTTPSIDLQVAITSPIAHQITTNTSFTVTGTASIHSNYGILGVQISINAGSFVPVLGTNTWTYVAALVQGTNTFVARVISTNGVTNLSAPVSIYYGLGNTIYVSANGNDSNDGYYYFAPVQNIATGIQKAQSLGISNIYLQQGRYTAGNGLNPSSMDFGLSFAELKGINIIGGWNNTFSAVLGTSVLDGQQNYRSVISVTNVTNIRFENLTITGGDSRSVLNQRGAGLNGYQMSQCILTNVVVYNNHASLAGGGLYLYSGENCDIHGVFSNNTADTGGGIYLSMGYGCIISGIVCSNQATENVNGGGGIYLYYTSNAEIHSIISSNIAGYGGGIRLWGASGTTFASDCVIEGNTATSEGGGIWTNSQVTGYTWDGSWGSGNSPDNAN